MTAEIPDYEHPVIGIHNRPQPQQPPTAMQDEQQQPAAAAIPEIPEFIKMPLRVAQQLASYYPVVRPFLKLARVKIPKDIDAAIMRFSGNPEDADAIDMLSSLAMGEQVNTPRMEEYIRQDGTRVMIPAPKIGDRVLDRDMAEQAYSMHFGEAHLSYREIAAHFTADLDCPVSFSTIRNYVEALDQEYAEQQSGRWKSILKTAVIIALPFIGLIIGHFLL